MPNIHKTTQDNEYPNDGFLELITRRKDSDVSSDADDVSCKQYQDELLQLCGYDSRSNDLKRILYSKVHFILNHKNADNMSDRVRILFLLLADRGCLFGEENSTYRDLKINAVYYKNARGNQKQEDIKQFIDQYSSAASVWRKEISRQGENMSVAQWLLTAIQNDADRKRHQAAWWLYRKQHAEVTNQNLEECVENYLLCEKHVNPSSYTDEQKKAAAESKEFQNWFDKERNLAEKGEGLNHAWLLNLEKCGESCWELIREELEGIPVYQQVKAACHDSSEVEDFVYKILIPYLYRCKNARMRTDGIKKTGLAARNEIEMFREEYQRLEYLSQEYLVQKCNGDERYLDEHLYSSRRSNYSPNSPIPVKSVLNAILEDARHLSINIDKKKTFNCVVNGMQFLCGRVFEMFTDPQLKMDSVSRADYPLIVFHDVHTYGHAYYINEEVSREAYGVFVRWLDHAGSRSSQRVQQLCFLRKLCDIFGLSPQERASDYDIYLKVYGSSIKSRKELQFWKSELSEGCPVPATIQFQIEVYDAWQNFLPPLTETLCYQPASALHLHGFQRFYEVSKNQKLMKKLSSSIAAYQIDSTKSIGGEYEKELARPVNRQAMQNLLSQYPSERISLDEYDVSVLTDNGGKPFDKNELLSLIKETAIRQYLWRRAKKKIAEQIQSEYGFSLIKMASPAAIRRKNFHTYNR